MSVHTTGPWVSLTPAQQAGARQTGVRLGGARLEGTQSGHQGRGVGDQGKVTGRRHPLRLGSRPGRDTEGSALSPGGTTQAPSSWPALAYRLALPSPLPLQPSSLLGRALSCCPCVTARATGPVSRAWRGYLCPPLHLTCCPSREHWAFAFFHFKPPHSLCS